MAPTSRQLSDARDHWIRGLHELAPFVQDYTDEEMSTLRELLAELQTVPTSEELAARYNNLGVGAPDGAGSLRFPGH